VLTFSEADLLSYHEIGPPRQFSVWIRKDARSTLQNTRLLAAILQFNERLRGALFELPQAASEARRFCEAFTLAARCEIIEGDFFT
jgi:hypothetical protein